MPLEGTATTPEKEETARTRKIWENFMMRMENCCVYGMILRLIFERSMIGLDEYLRVWYG